MKKLLMVSLCASALTGCATMTPTTETRASYAIYDVHAAQGLTASQVAEAIRTGLQKQTDQVQITQGIPPSPLPEKPGRFRLVNPFGQGMAALAGRSLQMPVCDDAILTARAGNTGMAQYGENTLFFLCVLPYQGGYHLDVYTQFSMASGGFSPQALGATLARGVVGDSSQFIPRTIASVVDSVKQTGASVDLVESYP
jgi:hypothetical protein